MIGNQQFRESIMQTFLYRVLLRAYPILDLPSSIASVLQPWNLPITRGVEVFDQPTDDDDISPVGQAIGKLEGPIQATGEAKYVHDRTSSSCTRSSSISTSNRSSASSRSSSSSSSSR